MKRRDKIILIFSIVYWLLIFIGIALMALAFSKVPIGSYGLRVNYFSPNVDELYYTSGLYHKSIYKFIKMWDIILFCTQAQNNMSWIKNYM
jgi:hypothetical protein